MESFHHKVINQIRPFLTKVLDVSDVINEVTFLSPRDREQIQNQSRHESKPEACAHFLEILHRHSVGSFVEFYCSVKKHRPDVANYIFSEVPPGERYRLPHSQNGACDDGPAYSHPSTSTLNRPPQADNQGTSLEDIPQCLWDQIETIVRSEYSFGQLFHNLPRREFRKTEDFTSHDEFSQLIDMLERGRWTIKRFIDELVMKIDKLSVQKKIIDILKDYHNYGACGDGPAYNNPRTSTLNRPPQANNQETSLEDIPQHLWGQVETIVCSEYGFEQLFRNLPRRQFIKTKDFTSYDKFSQLIDMLEGERWTIKRFIDELVMNIDEFPVQKKILDILKDYHNYGTSLGDIPQHLWDQIETIVHSECDFKQLFHNLPRRLCKKTKDFMSPYEFSQLIDMLEREGWTIKRFIDELVMNIGDFFVEVEILNILTDYHNYAEVIDVNTNQPVVCQDGSDNVYADKNADMEASNIRREPSRQHVLVPSETECDQTNIPSSYVGPIHIQPELSDTFGNVQGNLEGTENTIPKTIDDRTSITNMRETSPPTSSLHGPGTQYASPTEVTTPYHQTSKWGDAISVRHRQHFQAISDIITRSTVIRRWKELARTLEIPEHDIVTIDEENSLYERCYQMLLKWKQISGDSGTPQQLMKALIDMGHQEVADKIEEYLNMN